MFYVRSAKSMNLRSLLHMVGAVGVALGIEYDRTGIFTFLVPGVVGVIVLLASWVKNEKRESEFSVSRILPTPIFRYLIAQPIEPVILASSTLVASSCPGWQCWLVDW